VKIDADEILPHYLYQGADPPMGETLARLGFNVLVLCAIECQHPEEAFPGVRVVYAPMDDSPYVPKLFASRVAILVAREIRAYRRVLVCCHAGLNRSGLVCALSVRCLTGWPGERCLNHVQERRAGSLCNPAFAQWLTSLSAVTRMPASVPVSPAPSSQKP
jgi:protein-tyrosine phosphatase